jgi:hypothetical protein
VSKNVVFFVIVLYLSLADRLLSVLDAIAFRVQLNIYALFQLYERVCFTYLVAVNNYVF